MQPLIDVNQVLRRLGIDESVPLLVWVFDEAWAEENRDLVNGFLRATYAAKQMLAESQAEWDRIRPLTQAESDTILKLLRDAYRAGIPQHFGEAEVEAAERVFQILAREGGSELVGPSTELSPGTFWKGFEIESMTQ
jgi:NitT/TauT family transport system substrate-binding protein